jgi:hypothetical protein
MHSTSMYIGAKSTYPAAPPAPTRHPPLGQAPPATWATGHWLLLELELLASALCALLSLYCRALDVLLATSYCY